MKILVDADACPVKNTITSIAGELNIPVMLVKSFAHFSHAEEPDGVVTVYVDSESEAADYKIMQLAKKEDLIITQDYGLASLGLAKGCHVMHHKGFVYTHDNIDQLLDSRYLSAMERKSGIRTKGPKPFKDSDRDNFKLRLQQVLEELLSNN